MAPRRFAIVALAIGLAVAAPACRFSRGDNSLPPTSSTVSTIDIFEETSTSIEETTTIETATTARSATTIRKSTATTAKPAPRPATTARPVVTVPHCTVSAGDAFYGSTWTASVSSTFPSATVVIDLSWSGGSGNYSGITDANGSFTKTQRVQPSMRGQTVRVSTSVGGRSCSTSFKVS